MGEYSRGSGGRVEKGSLGEGRKRRRWEGLGRGDGRVGYVR